MTRHILITGASTGIGAETALRLAAGNKIFVHCHSSFQAAREVAASVVKKGGESPVVQADLSTENGCRR